MAMAIMLQGTMSNVGKSVLTAGLCRVFHQEGYRVAPFKSQNMALNSFVTREGLEMGRAQVMQAEAAGIEPSVLMNPILLKPTTDVGSQVIVNGEVISNMPAIEYFRYKKSLVPEILKAYRALEELYEIIVIEGAGSPAEINLKSNDIVNMGLAEMVDAPVLLIGDIDRGGIFASLYGTIALLEEHERARIKGTIINKFRGDVEILRPGLTMLEDLTKVPVLGVMPWFNLDLEDEDSLAPRLDRSVALRLLDIAVVRLPHISNFTDFVPLEQIETVAVRYVKSVRELGAPDLIVLPGTKNTMGDLSWLRSSGLEAVLQKHVAAGVPLIGICGGYQMLGHRLEDRENVEYGGEMPGMNLLDIDTVFQAEKVLTRVSGRVTHAEGIFSSLIGARFDGYEIHMGHSVHSADMPAFAALSGNGGKSIDGSAKGNVWGCHVHGLFESGDLAERLIHLLLQRKGLSVEAMPVLTYRKHKELQYNQLADLVRQHIDIKSILHIMHAGSNA